MQEIVLPELIAELDGTLILVISSVDDALAPLFERVYRGEEVNYGFKWDLMKMEDVEYYVGLIVSWGPEEESITIGFPKELWNFLSLVRESGQLMVMTDWEMLGGEPVVDSEIHELMMPKAIIIHEAYKGMETLSQQVIDEALLSEPKEELYDLLDVLKPASTPSLLN